MFQPGISPETAGFTLREMRKSKEEKELIPKTYTLRQLREIQEEYHRDIKGRSCERYDDEVVAFLDWLEKREKEQVLNPPKFVLRTEGGKPSKEENES